MVGSPGTGKTLLARAMPSIFPAMSQLNLSARAYHRILKLARTIADLAECEEIASVHLAEALHASQSSEINDELVAHPVLDPISITSRSFIVDADLPYFKILIGRQGFE